MLIFFYYGLRKNFVLVMLWNSIKILFYKNFFCSNLMFYNLSKRFFGLLRLWNYEEFLIDDE